MGKQKNHYNEFWINKPKAVHEYEIGTYHVSQVGNSHSDMEDNEHSGPCLRQGYYQYLNPAERRDETIGNFHIGNILHEKIQEILKLNNPAVINEFPLRIWLDDIIISGSVDSVSFSKKGIHIIDFKTASQYTLPKGKYDKNVTHFTQVYIYAGLLSQVVKLPIVDISIVYINKHNLATFKQTEKYNKDKALEIYEDFIERCFYLHNCLTKKELPIAEPMKWCKYCDYKEICKEDDGDKNTG